MLGVVQTAEGLPIHHEVFAGNAAETATLVPTIEKVLARYPIQQPVDAAALLIRPTNRLNFRGISATMLAWKKTMPESSVQPSNTKDGGRSSEHTSEAGRGRRLLRRLG